MISLADIEARTTPEPNTGCWLWTGERTTKGYGRLERDGVVTRVHRLVFALVHGSVPEKRFVLHRCHQPCCANPAHLYAGTARDNILDMWRAGRAPQQRPGHPFHPRSTAVHLAA